MKYSGNISIFNIPGTLPREYSPEFHRELFPDIPGIYHGYVPRIFHEHIFARQGVTLPKQIKGRFEDCCIEYTVGEIKEDDADSAYLKIISRGGLTVPSYSLQNYVCEAFTLLDYFNEIISKSDIPARAACEYTLINMLDSCHSIIP